MLRHIAAFLIVATATITPVRVPGQQNLASGAGISPITGSTQIEHVGAVRWSYYFDHNALKDAELVAGNLVALTESGNLVRFDPEKLSIAGHALVPGRGISIARGFGGKLLIGAEDGQVFDVNSETLALTPVTKANGRVLWLCTGKVIGKPNSIVAIIDARADVMPWPGEPFKAYETRSARIERQVINPLKVLIFSEGTAKYIPFNQGSFALPNAFLLDDSDRLWMGADKGEWGGEYSYMELRTGKVHRFDTGSGVLGFLKVHDGRVLAYGGMSHLGMETGFIADVSKSSSVYLREFTNRPQKDLPDAAKRVLEQAKTRLQEDAAPQSAIDFVIEDTVGSGFSILSAHDVGAHMKVKKFGQCRAV